MRTRLLTIRRGFMCERWRVGAHLRIYRGHGLANFDFRLGFPRHSHNAVRMEKEMLELDL